MVKLYCDTGNLADFEREDVDGFTTNPSLCRAAGVTNYREFCRQAAADAMDRPVSLEVCAQDRAGMVQDVYALAELGKHVFVKVPECDAKGRSNVPVIAKLCREGVRVNVTAILALPQVESLLTALEHNVPAIVSIFAGRIADTGRDPAPTVQRAAELLAKWKAKVLWASTRECLNIVQAERAGADIVTCSPALLDKWKTMKGKGLRSLARATVQQFDADAQAAGFTL